MHQKIVSKIELVKLKLPTPFNPVFIVSYKRCYLLESLRVFVYFRNKIILKNQTLISPLGSGKGAAPESRGL